MKDKIILQNHKKSTADILTGLLLGLYLILLLCKYPLMLIHFFPTGNLATSLFTVTPGALCALSAVLLLLNIEKTLDLLKRNYFFAASAGVITILAGIHFFSYQHTTSRELFFDLHPVLIPLCAAMVHKRYKKMFISFFIILWTINLIQSGYQIIESKECIGIPGNRNWHAAFVASLTPVIASVIYLFIKKTDISTQLPRIQKRISKILLSSLLLFTAFFYVTILYKTQSRGAVLALILTGMLFFFLELKNSNSVSVQKLSKIVFMCFALISAAGIIICILFYGRFIAGIINRDVRLPLWYGAFNLFLSHIFTGVGTFAYENFFSYKMPVDLFLRDHYFAARYMHPHNQFLYIAGSYGIFGLAAFIYIYLYPVIYFIKNYRYNGIYFKSMLSAYTILLIHAQLDKIAFQWPTSYLFLFLQGILWYKILTVKKSGNMILTDSSKFNPVIRTAGTAGAVCVFVLFSSMMYANICSSAYSRLSDQYSDRKEYKKALEFKRKAVIAGNFPNDIYDAGMLELKAFRNYPEAYRYFRKLEEHPAGIVVHRNMRIAECLIFMNRKKEALYYLNNESAAFPLSSLVLYNKIILEKELGLNKQAEKTAELLNAQLKFKGLTRSDMQIILKYPELDNKFHLVKKFRKINKEHQNIKDKR